MPGAPAEAEAAAVPGGPAAPPGPGPGAGPREDEGEEGGGQQLGRRSPQRPADLPVWMGSPPAVAAAAAAAEEEEPGGAGALAPVGGGGGVPAGAGVQAAVADLIEEMAAHLNVRPALVSQVGETQVRGEQVDAHTVDVTVSQTFRAHFGKPLSHLYAGAAGALADAPGGGRELQVAGGTELQVVLGGGAVVPAGHGRGKRRRGAWELESADIILGRRIAVGGFAEVFVASWNGSIVAVKQLLGIQTSRDAMEFTKEVELLANLRHPNLILFMGYTIAPVCCIVTEYMRRGSLHSVIHEQFPGEPLPLKLQRTVAISVARGMEYLHAKTPSILHCDLKSPNILVDDKWRIKIGDFGLSRVKLHTMVMGSKMGGTGTPEWMAPEVLRCEPFAEPSDVYSYGVVLWEILTGRVPWQELHSMQVVGAVGYSGHVLEVPEPGEAVDATLARLCAACMAPAPADRPTFAEVIDTMEAAFGIRTPAGEARAPAPRLAAAAGGDLLAAPASPSAVVAEIT